jgi:uncharacterized membrane protein YbhN (UPF0104 family)
VAGAVLLVYLSIHHDVASTLKQLGWWLIGGACIIQIGIFIVSLRYAVIVRALGGSLGPLKSIELNYSSFFYFFFTPFSIGLEAARMVKLIAADPGMTPIRAGLASALDRLIGASGFLIIFVLFAPMVISAKYLAWAAGAAVVVALIALLFLRALARRMARARQMLLVAWQKRYAVAIALMLSGVSQAFIYLAVWVASRGLATDISLPNVMFAISGGMLAQVVPLNVAGVGSLELVSAVLYPLANIPVADGVVLVAALYVCRLTTACVGGCVELREMVLAKHRAPGVTGAPM